jgi:2-methylcitrate dehydratase PrpD
LPGLTETLARFIHDTTFESLPPVTLDRAKKVIADTFAVILAGAGSEVAEPLLRYQENSGENGDSPILGSTRSAAPAMAALINGTFGHAMDYDDVLSIMPGHPSALIVAALCAAIGDRPVSGRRFIEAYALGLETGGKLGIGITMGHYRRGYHGTGTLGTFSGTSAVAKLAGLDVDQTRTAFGIAASMASGLQRNFGTMTKPLHTGLGARNALTAVRLAESGVTAAPDILEARAGFFYAYGTEESKPEVAAQRLGDPWVLDEPGVALKRFPCCYASHRGMNGVLELRKQLGFTADDVEKLTCRMPPGSTQVLIYSRPRTGLEGKFSLEYSLAAGVIDGAYSLRSFSDEAVNRPEVASLIERIEGYEDERCGSDDPNLHSRSPGSRGFVQVEVQLKDGRTGKVDIAAPPWSPSFESTWEEIETKFVDCASEVGLAAATARQAFGQLRGLEGVSDVRSVIGLLRPGS